MKYILHRLIVLLLIFCLLIINGVFAASDFTCSIKVRPDSGAVSVVGVLPALYKSENVTIQVIGPGRQIQELKNAGAVMKDIVNYQEETTADNAGAFAFDYKMSGEPGEYTACFGIRGEAVAYSTTFTYYGKVFVEDVVRSINQAKKAQNAGDMKNIITQNYDKLNMNCTLYKAFVEKGEHLDDFYLAMTKNKEVSSLVELEKQMDDTIVLTYINLSSQPDAIGELFITYNEYFGLKENTAYLTYTNILNEQKQSEVCSTFLGKGFTEFSDIVTHFVNTSILTAANLQIGWGNIKDVLELNSKIINLDFTQYKTLKSPEEVYRSLEGITFHSLAGIKSAFDNAVNARYLIENPVTGGGSTGGKSGGGGSMTVSQPQPILNNEEKKEIFTDLTGFEWAKEGIEVLHSMGIVKGKSEKLFMPNDKITREEFVKLLVMGANINNIGAKIDFADTNENEWYYTYVASAVYNGIINGKDGNRFGVGELITREDMATAAYRTILSLKPEVKDAKKMSGFTDQDEIAPYALEGVSFMQSANIIAGTGDGKFSPKDYSTRAQAVTIVYRLIRFLQSNQ